MPDTAPAPPEPSETDAQSVEIEHPPELRTIFLGALSALALLAACYAAAAIVLPIVLAFVLNAVFQPVLRFLLKLGLPRVVAALLIVLGLISLFVVFGLLLSGPFTGWIGKLPLIIPRLQERLHFLSAGFHSLQSALKHVEALAPGKGAPTVAVQGTPLPQLVLYQVRMVAGGAFTTALVLFFVLVAGDQFLRRLVDILPRFRNKRQAVDIAHEVEQDISIYLATITIMNTLVGFATAAVAWGTGLGDPLLWGTIAFVLNYVPILGPTAGVILFAVAGVVEIEPLWLAFAPAVLYLLIHLVEGETITPMLLAARFTVNPVLVTIGVIFWYWMWGVVGAILSTPMLAIAKIVCDRIDSLRPVGHFISGEPAITVPIGPANGKAAR